MTLRGWTILILVAGLGLWAWFERGAVPGGDVSSRPNTSSAPHDDEATSATPLTPRDDSARDRAALGAPDPAPASFASGSASPTTARVRVRVVDATNRRPMPSVLVSSVVESRPPLEAPRWRIDSQLASTGDAFDTLRSDADGRVEIRALTGDALRIQVLDERRSRVVAGMRANVTKIETDVELQVPPPRRVGEDIAFFVRVLDAETHAPIAGATIEEPRYRPRSWKTNDEGLAECQGGHRFAIDYPVTATGYGMRRVHMESGHDSPQSAVVVELNKGASLTLRLSGADGHPRRNASLELSAPADRVSTPARSANVWNFGAPPATWSATTDDDGWARFTDLTPHVLFEVHEVDEARPFEPRRGWVAPESILLEPGEQRTVEWTMRGKCRLTGRALGVDGKPLSGVDVWCVPTEDRTPRVLERADRTNASNNVRWPPGDVPEDTTEVKTGVDGRFTFDGVDPGLVLVGIAPPHRSLDDLFPPIPSSYDVSTPHTAEALGADTSETPVAVARCVDVPIGVTQLEIDVHAEVGRRIRGRLLDPVGNACTDGRVSATSVETGLKLVVACGREGRYEFSALPLGTYAVESYWHPRYPSSERVTVPAGSTGVDLHLRSGGAVQGRVVDENGCRGRGETLLVTEDRIAARSYSSWNDPGSIDFPAVAPGTYVIVASNHDGQVGMSAPFEVRADATVEGIEVRVSRGGLVGVRLSGSRRDGTVTILRGGVPLHVQSLQRGERRDFDVPAGPAVVRCNWPGEPTRVVERTVTVILGETTDVVLDSDSR